MTIVNTQKEIELKVLEVIKSTTGRELTLDCNLSELQLNTDKRRAIFMTLQSMMSVSTFTSQQMIGLDTPRGIATRLYLKRNQAIGNLAA